MEPRIVQVWDTTPVLDSKHRKRIKALDSNGDFWFCIINVTGDMNETEWHRDPSMPHFEDRK